MTKLKLVYLCFRFLKIQIQATIMIIGTPTPIEPPMVMAIVSKKFEPSLGSFCFVDDVVEIVMVSFCIVDDIVGIVFVSVCVVDVVVEVILVSLDVV